MKVNRRGFVVRSALWTAASMALRHMEAQSAKSRIDRSRISAISDEVAMSPEESVAFANHFGLQWLELRDIPSSSSQKRPYFFLPEDELRSHAKMFRGGGIKISFINTNLLKKGLPGTVLASGKPLTSA